MSKQGLQAMGHAHFLILAEYLTTGLHVRGGILLIGDEVWLELHEKHSSHIGAGRQ
jgi:hypothetical protein